MQQKVKEIVLFLIKSITFTIIFWGMWSYAIRPITSAQNSNSSNSKSNTENAENEAAMAKYYEQAAKADEQQRRMDALITKQEAQSRRFDAVLSAWEKQSKVAK